MLLLAAAAASMATSSDGCLETREASLQLSPADTESTISLAVDAAGDMLELELRPAVPLRVLVGRRRLDFGAADLPSCLDPDGSGLAGAGGVPAGATMAAAQRACVVKLWVDPGMRFELVGVPAGTAVQVRAAVGAHGDVCQVPLMGGLGVHLTRVEGDAP